MTIKILILTIILRKNSSCYIELDIHYEGVLNRLEKDFFKKDILEHNNFDLDDSKYFKVKIT
jgi:hypothetical protein